MAINLNKDSKVNLMFPSQNTIDNRLSGNNFEWFFSDSVAQKSFRSRFVKNEETNPECSAPKISWLLSWTAMVQFEWNWLRRRFWVAQRREWWRDRCVAHQDIGEAKRWEMDRTFVLVMFTFSSRLFCHLVHVCKVAKSQVKYCIKDNLFKRVACDGREVHARKPLSMLSTHTVVRLGSDAAQATNTVSNVTTKCQKRYLQWLLW